MERMRAREGEDPTPNMDRSNSQEYPSIKGGGEGRCGSPQRHVMDCDQESLQNGERNPQGWTGQSVDPERDIWGLLKALPTKSDIQQLINAVEQSCMQAVASVKKDVRDLGYRVEGMEKEQEVIIQAVTETQESMKKYEETLNAYRDQLDEYENRDKRQNIRIKGLKESITATELAPVAQKMFGQILGD